MVIWVYRLLVNNTGVGKRLTSLKIIYHACPGEIGSVRLAKTKFVVAGQLLHKPLYHPGD